jgi:hypothetical protein
MDIVDTLVASLRDASVILIVFGTVFAFGILRGQRSLLALTFGLYLALLLSLEFPYYESISHAATFLEPHTLKLVFFALFAVFGTILFGRLLSRVIDVMAIEGIGRKVILSLLTTALALSYCYHVLQIADMINPGSKANMLFASHDSFFWWLLAPLIGIFILF